MLKRMISLLLCLVMVLSALPAQAIAQETMEEPTTESLETVIETIAPVEVMTEPAEEIAVPTAVEEVVAEATGSDIAMAAATSGTCGNNLTWELNDSTLIISGTGDMMNYSQTVTAPWYSNRADIQHIILEEGITHIGDFAFSDFSNLTSVSISDSITSIGRAAFNDCEKLASIIIPDGVTSIGKFAFDYCSNLASVSIPETVAAIGESAFEHCRKLTTIVIPDGITVIADSTFNYCTSLTGITLPKSITAIGVAAFEDCRSLTGITIPNGVTIIGNSAFYNCYSLTDITIPESVTTIGNNAFSGCINLTNISLPESITAIGDYVFRDCRNLTSITIPQSVTSVGHCAFSDCSRLTSITMPDSVILINNDTFRNCNSLCDIYYGGTQTQWNALGNNAPEATYTHYNVTDSTNHWYNDTLEATCTQDGYIREICNCGYERNKEIIPHQGHNFVNGICTVCGEGGTEVTYTYGQSAQIKLIEPWGLKANAKISTAAGVVDYSQLHDYGVYFIRKSALDRVGLTQETITAEDILSDPDALKKTKADGVTVNGAYLTAIFDRDIYTYELSDSIFVMFYFVTEEGADPIYVPIRERNLKDLAEARKDDTTGFPNEKERIVYGYMVDLFNAITDYREDYFRN